MKNIIFKFRKRYTLIGTIIFSAIILISLTIVVAGNIIVSNKNEREIINNVNVIDDDNQKWNIMSIKINLSTLEPTYKGFNKYGYEFANEIIENAKTIENGEFSVGEQYYIVALHETFDSNIYIIYDRSISHYNNLTSINLAIIAFFLISAFSLLVMWYLSKLIVKPIEESLKEQEEFIENASHELKTPLAVVLSNLSAMEDYPDSTIKDNKKWFNNINNSINKMNNLVLQMLELSRSESLNDSLQLEELNIKSILEAEIFAMDALCFEKNIKLDYQECPLINATANETLLSKVFEILIDNAIKYTPKNGTVSVNVIDSKKHVKVIFRNTGKGLNKENLEHIFDRFYKKEANYKDNNSFGLGLAIAKSSIEAMKGTIEVNSDSKSFTEFIVTLNK